MKKRLLSLILVSILALQPVSFVKAEESNDLSISEFKKTETFNTGKHVNPVYSEQLKKSDLHSIEHKDFPSFYSEEDEIYFETDYSTIVNDIRNEMINRNEQFSVFYASTTEVTTEEEFLFMIEDFLWSALEENNNPEAGDYLLWHFGGYQCEGYIYETTEFDGYYYYEIVYNMTYLSTKEQETQVTDKVRSVIRELDLDYTNVTDYEKTSKIYNYICENVAYDWDNYGDVTYDKQFTAYGALIEGKAVCQGFSTLFYRMLEEADVDARVVVSIEEEAHAWNLSEIDGTYYYSDSTWDEDKSDYEYFLQGETDFLLNHTPDPEWNDFLVDYNISDEDYVCPENCEHEWSEEYVIDTEATCRKTGWQSIHCLKCDVIKEGTEVIVPCVPHDISYFEKVEATCTHDGRDEHYYCSSCATFFGDANGEEEIDYNTLTIPRLPHITEKIEAVAATCTESGNIEYYVCETCGYLLSDPELNEILSESQIVIKPLGHNYQSVVIKPTKEEQGYTKHTCSRCEDSYMDSYIDVLPEGFGNAYVYRIFGENRYDTAFKTADVLKEQLGVEQFENIVIVSGTNFPDALAGSYFAKQKNAPILLASKKNAQQISDYIRENLREDGRVYILGGTSAVPDSIADSITGFEVERIYGQDRYETNLEILKKAGVTSENLIVCTGKSFADSLSVSAVEQPILLVGKKLTSGQKEFLSNYTNRDFFIIGGPAAVSDDIFYELGNYGMVERIGGTTRYETSVKVAERFFDDPNTAVLAYAKNFPDGLCAGPLAMTKNAPLILTATGAEAIAIKYARAEQIWVGAVLGGPGLISDNSVLQIFDLDTLDNFEVWQ